MMNGRPISNRKKVQILVALTILAWATQTLLQQWARGQDAPAPMASERFVPGAARVGAGATLEVKAEATVHGGDVKLRQICRWSDADRQFFAPLADLTIAHFQGNAPFQSVSLDEIRLTLHDAGANLGLIRFSGSMACTVARSDVQYDEGSALQQWADARAGRARAATPLADKPKPGIGQLRASPAGATTQPVETSFHTLKDMIIADASIRLNVPADQLQITFNPADDKVLLLSEPQFRFNLEPQRVVGLGNVEWTAQIITDTNSKKVPIAATARAWIREVVLVHPLAYRQVIQPEDLVEKRILTDQLPDDTLLTIGQCVGQETARELKPGTVVTARMVSAVELVKPGQLITVIMTSGNVRIKTAALAKEAGSFGQSVRVQNEATLETYQVVLTGPQEGTIGPPPPGK